MAAQASDEDTDEVRDVDEDEADELLRTHSYLHAVTQITDGSTFDLAAGGDLLDRAPDTNHGDDEDEDGLGDLKRFGSLLSLKTQTIAHETPLTSANLFSRLTFSWVSKLIALGRKKTLQPEDLYGLPAYLQSATVVKSFGEAWDQEVQRVGIEEASVFRVICRVHFWGLFEAWLLITLWVGFFVLTPAFFLRRLVDFTGDEDAPVGEGVGLAIGMLLSELMRSVAAHAYWFAAIRVAVKLRSTMYGLVYSKALVLRDLSGYTVGELVNLCSNDGQRMFDATTLVPFVYISAVMTVVVLVLSWLFVGPFALVGCLVFVLMLPLQSVVAKLAGKLRRKSILQTDHRVRLISEILNCVKLIKMYAWEGPFGQRIRQIRKKERKVLQHAAYLQSTLVSLVPVAPVAASVLTFSLRAANGDNLTASDVFATAAMFNLMRFTLSTVPRAVRAASEARIGLTRLKDFLVLANHVDRHEVPKDPHLAVELRGATFAWAAPLHTPTGSGAKKPSQTAAKATAEQPAARPLGDNEARADAVVLHDITLSVRLGELVGICGRVGSGKSSLLSGILGQMKLVTGQVFANDDVAYVSQQAWIQSITVRDNILFGQPYDKEKYNRILDVCCLKEDLDILAAGDETEIGERGINLSGGQKQRVSLARALYSEKAVYLLDDPLSAVDGYVGRRIFDNCIKDYLGSRTVIFVTHQLQYLPQCDRVLLVDGGRIAEEGTYDSMLVAGTRFHGLVSAQQLQHDAEEEEKAEEVGEGVRPHALVLEPSEGPDQGKSHLQAGKHRNEAEAVLPAQPQQDATVAAEASTKAAEAAVAAGKSLVQAESREKGAVTWRTYVKWMRAGGTFFGWLLVFLLFITATLSKTFSEWWLSWWMEQGDGEDHVGDERGSISDHPDRQLYTLIYGMSAVLLIVVQIIRAVCYNRRVLKASSHLFERLFDTVVKAPMSFFDQTPTGRIINRFSKDLDDIDVQLPNVIEQLLQNILQIVASLILVATVLPWFLIACVPILCAYVVLVKYFRPTQRELKRLDNVSRSPVFSQLTAALQGLATLHAFMKENTFRSKFAGAIDENTRAFFGFWVASRWFALRLDLVTISLTGSTALLVALLRDDIDPELAGLVLFLVSALGGTFQFTTRMTAEAEARFTSVERITGYIETLPAEGFDDREQAVPEHWPANGSIEMKDLVVRYRPQLPPALKSVSCVIRAREKIGIAGRTGSGKSTLVSCFFRMLEASEGSILIDGIDIANVNLHRLRASLAIIPQDPTLFVGTVRYNLDPFDEHSDDRLWDALERAHLKDAIAALDRGLDEQVVENGENFSVGQRQLLCLARALLRDSPILVLDEATSAADSQTDAAIQDTIRESFAGRRTLVVIAHRLDTILDSDRILILDDGRVAEFDAPDTLLDNPDSQLNKMLGRNSSDA
eukprot:m.260888 g.260888  ORF g.260888 m.260888 type:complete len:1419 (-) comp19220_c0_seq3:108-4364(-)